MYMCCISRRFIWYELLQLGHWLVLGIPKVKRHLALCFRNWRLLGGTDRTSWEEGREGINYSRGTKPDGSGSTPSDNLGAILGKAALYIPTTTTTTNQNHTMIFGGI